MKKNIMKILVALALCVSATSFASCGNRSENSASTSTATTTASSSADSASNADTSTNTDANANSTPQTDNAPAIESSGSAKIVWTSSADIEGGSEIFTAVFNVKDGAADGLSEVTIGGDIVVADETFSMVDVEVVAGGANIGGEGSQATTPANAALVVDTVGANAGDTIEIPVSIANMDYCSTFDFTLCFDSNVLELVDITGSEAVEENGLLLFNAQ